MLSFLYCHLESSSTCNTLIWVPSTGLDSDPGVNHWWMFRHLPISYRQDCHLRIFFLPFSQITVWLLLTFHHWLVLLKEDDVRMWCNFLRQFSNTNLPTCAVQTDAPVDIFWGKARLPSRTTRFDLRFDLKLYKSLFYYCILKSLHMHNCSYYNWWESQTKKLYN